MLFEFMWKHPLTIVFAIWFIGFILGYNFERFLDWFLDVKNKELSSDDSEEI